ncbi:MAG: hypothetical protein GVY13_11765 [Alphaproteobacteria bacterium]|jgi:hypothetical protein|nr:hypothetical protein [Alphaproteobacteria bacterium]
MAYGSAKRQGDTAHAGDPAAACPLSADGRFRPGDHNRRGWFDLFAVNHRFSIHGVGSSVADAITDALTEFDILWTEIACEDDDALYTDAKALKADLLSLVTDRGLYRIDRLSLGL